MRGVIAICVGLGMVLGAGVALGAEAGVCCSCTCNGSDSPSFCVDDPKGTAEITESCPRVCGSGAKVTCDSAPVSPEVGGGALALTDGSSPCDHVPACEGVPRFPQDPQPAPTASPYGIAALLIALGGFGAYRLRKRAA